MQKQEYLYKDPKHAVNLNDMRLKDKYCDVTIKVDGKEIRVHKVILAANLKYFEMMFSSNSFQESQSGVITMASVDKADLELIVSYAYTGEILLTDSNALNLLELANYLSEDDIKEACIAFLEKHLKVEEACRAYKFANTIECLSLKNAAKAKILTNFRECSESADYQNFDPEILTNILSNGKTQSIQMQKMLFEGIIKWIMHNAKNRKSCLESLLNSIDITKLKADDVMSCLYENALHYEEEYGITKDAIIYYKANQIERKEQEQILMVISSECFFQFYNFIEKKWSSQQAIPSAGFNQLGSYSNTILNDKLYYISRDSGRYYLQVFDPSSKQVTRLHLSSSIIEAASLCACSRFVYICGGREENGSRSDQLLRYDPLANSLETLAPTKHKRSSAAGIFYQDCFYVLGGFGGSSDLRAVEKFDPVRNEWTALAPMCKGRCGHAVAILDGNLYACGGCIDPSEESSVEVYDPTTNSWQLVASMNKPRSAFLVVAHERKLLAIGGSAEKTVEAYDPSRDQWEMDHEMSLGLQVDYPLGGLISSSCVTSTE